MKNKKILLSFCLILALIGLNACGKSGDKTTETTTTSEVTTQEVTTEEDATEEVTTEVTTEAPTTQAPSTQEPTTAEATTAATSDAKPTKATGVFNGFGDSNSVEITLSNGDTQTFFVYDEAVKAKLEKVEDFSKIKFTYGPLKGQVNPQILSVE